MSKRTARPGFTLIELMIVVAIIGILAAIAIPNFIKFQARSKQSEVRANLRALSMAEKVYYQEFDTFDNRVSKIGFFPERGNRYAYALLVGIKWEPRDQATINQAEAAVWGGIEADTFKYPGIPIGPIPLVVPSVVAGSDGRFTASARGNVDNDAAFDDWSISSVSRSSGAASDQFTTCAAGNNPAGEPCHDANDV